MSDAGEAPVTIYDVEAEDGRRVDVRRLPGLVLVGIRILWQAGRGDALLSSGLQAFNGVGLVLQLLIGREALAALLSAVRSGGSLAALVPWIVAICLITAVTSVASAVQRERQELLGELVARYVQGQVLDVAARANLEAFETPSFHNRMQRMQLNQHRPLSLVYGLTGLFSAVISAAGVVTALVVIQPLLVPLLALVFLPAWLAASRRGREFFIFYWRMTPRDRERQYVGGLLTDRDAAKEVIGFGLAPFLRRRYDALYAERIDGLRAVARRQFWYTVLADLAIGTVLAGVLFGVGWLTLSGRVQVADAGVAVAAVAVAGAGLARAGWAAGSLSEASLYLDDYLTFTRIGSDVAAPATGPVEPAFGVLEVNGVSFRYPSADKFALEDVSMRISAGEVVALVGENGSGKTTLAKLLAGLYAPASGVIRWDGVDVGELDPDLHRRRIAVIFQDFLRYHLSARDNIGLGRHEAIGDLDAIRRAAAFAGIDDELSALRLGYDTQLGPEFLGGTDLSVGQWQRTALARAFFRDAGFVVLDEPTASLDPRAEHDLFARIRELLSGRTVLLISHRFSSVRSADRIYVLDAGRIVEQGTHEELLANGGLYADLFHLQAAAYLPEETGS